MGLNVKITKNTLPGGDAGMTNDRDVYDKIIIILCDVVTDGT